MRTTKLKILLNSWNSLKTVVYRTSCTHSVTRLSFPSTLLTYCPHPYQHHAWDLFRETKKTSSPRMFARGSSDPRRILAPEELFCIWHVLESSARLDRLGWYTWFHHASCFCLLTKKRKASLCFSSVCICIAYARIESLLADVQRILSNGSLVKAVVIVSLKNWWTRLYISSYQANSKKSTEWVSYFCTILNHE
jgi:hypothetical protein